MTLLNKSGSLLASLNSSWAMLMWQTGLPSTSTTDTFGMKLVATKYVQKLLNFDSKNRRMSIAQEPKTSTTIRSCSKGSVERTKCVKSRGFLPLQWHSAFWVFDRICGKIFHRFCISSHICDRKQHYSHTLAFVLTRLDLLRLFPFPKVKQPIGKRTHTKKSVSWIGKRSGASKLLLRWVGWINISIK